MVKISVCRLQNGMKAWHVAHMYESIWTFLSTLTSWHWPHMALISHVIWSRCMFWRHYQNCCSKLFVVVINLISDLSHQHYSPVRPGWSSQTPGFPGTNIKSTVRSHETRFCNSDRNLWQKLFWKLKHALCTDAMHLWYLNTVVCNGGYCNYVTLDGHDCVHLTD